MENQTFVSWLSTNLPQKSRHRLEGYRPSEAHPALPMQQQPPAETASHQKEDENSTIPTQSDMTSND
jgi:hypothetical protein